MSWMTNHKMTTVLFCKEMMTLKFVEFQVENYDSDEDKLELQSDSESEDNVKKESSLEDSILHQSHLHSGRVYIQLLCQLAGGN